MKNYGLGIVAVSFLWGHGALAQEQVKSEHTTATTTSDGIFSRPDERGAQLMLLTGLNQPILLRGANLAFVATAANGWSFETSFGFGLNYANVLTDQDQALYDSVTSPVTGGIGLGYDFLHQFARHGLALYFEPKFTSFTIDPQGPEASFTYLTYTLGAGLYYTFFAWKGLVVQPSIRYWHPVASSLSNDRFTFTSASGQEVVHERRAPGMNGFIANISIGWAFDM